MTVGGERLAGAGPVATARIRRGRLSAAWAAGQLSSVASPALAASGRGLAALERCDRRSSGAGLSGTGASRATRWLNSSADGLRALPVTGDFAIHDLPVGVFSADALDRGTGEPGPSVGRRSRRSALKQAHRAGEISLSRTARSPMRERMR